MRIGSAFVGVVLVLGVTSADAGQRAGDDLITARATALDPEDVSVDEAGELSVILLELPERDLPLMLRVSSETLTFPEDRLGWDAVVDPLAVQPRLRVPFVAGTTVGIHPVVATVEYSICSGDWCRQKHVELRWSVVVTASSD